MDNFCNVYCINLPKSHDRRTKMDSEFKKIGVEPVYISAVSPIDENFKRFKKRYVDSSFRNRCHCAKKCSHTPRPLRQTEIAICFSHHGAYKKIVENNDKISLVVEDDVVFHNDFPKLIDYLFQTRKFKEVLLQNKPVIAFCGGRNNPGLEIRDLKRYDYHLTRDGFYSNYCCIINNAAAKLLKKRAIPVVRPDDSFKRNLIADGKMQGFHIRPSLVGELSAGINMKPIFNRFSKTSSTMDFRNTLQNQLRRKKEPRNLKKDKNKARLEHDDKNKQNTIALKRRYHIYKKSKAQKKIIISNVRKRLK